MSNKSKILFMIIIILSAMMAVLYYLNNFSPLSSVNFTEAIFENVDELAIMNSHAIKDLQPQYADLNEIEEYYCKLIGYEQNEYSVAGYRFKNSRDALKFFQQDIKQEHFNEKFDPAWMPFTWYASHENGLALFGLIAQKDVLLIESSTSSLSELAQFQNWLASFLTKELTDSEMNNNPSKTDSVKPS